MAYISNSWTDRNVQYPNRYQLKDTSTGLVIATYDIVASPGVVTDSGTPITASVMTNIDSGILTLIRKIRCGGLAT